jgi:hypothetical protein
VGLRTGLGFSKQKSVAEDPPVPDEAEGHIGVATHTVTLTVSERQTAKGVSGVTELGKFRIKCADSWYWKYVTLFQIINFGGVFC